jgi:hypothetical protein
MVVGEVAIAVFSVVFVRRGCIRISILRTGVFEEPQQVLAVSFVVPALSVI